MTIEDGREAPRERGRPRLRDRNTFGVEALLFTAAVVTCAAFLFGGFGEAGSIHLASAFR